MNISYIQKRLKNTGADKIRQRLLASFCARFWDGLKTKSLNTPRGKKSKNHQHPQRKKSSKTQTPPEEITSKNPKCINTHQQPPEEIPSRHPAHLNLILNPPSATREVQLLNYSNFPTHIIALNIREDTTPQFRIAFSLCLPVSTPHREQNKNKIAPSRFVYLPTFPDRKQPPQKKQTRLSRIHS